MVDITISHTLTDRNKYWSLHSAYNTIRQHNHFALTNITDFRIILKLVTNLEIFLPHFFSLQCWSNIMFIRGTRSHVCTYATLRYAPLLTPSVFFLHTCLQHQSNLEILSPICFWKKLDIYLLFCLHKISFFFSLVPFRTQRKLLLGEKWPKQRREDEREKWR